MKAKFELTFLSCEAYEKGEWRTKDGNRDWVKNGEVGYRLKLMDVDPASMEIDLFEYTTDLKAPIEWNMMDLVEVKLDVKEKDKDGKSRTSFLEYGKRVKKATLTYN